MEHEEDNNTKEYQFSLRRVYYATAVGNIVIAILVINMWIATVFDNSKKRSSLIPAVGVMMQENAKMQVTIERLEKKIDDLKRELEEMKQK